MQALFYMKSVGNNKRKQKVASVQKFVNITKYVL